MHQNPTRPPFGSAVQERFRTLLDNQNAVFTGVYRSIRQRDPPVVGQSDRRLCACPEPSLVPVCYRETQLHRFKCEKTPCAKPTFHGGEILSRSRW